MCRHIWPSTQVLRSWTLVLMLGLHWLYRPEKASAWGCSHQENQPASAVMGCPQKPLWASFSHHCYHWFPFSLLSSAQEARLAGPLSDFSWFRLYAFSSKPSSFINLRSFLILMHQSIIIPLDSFWQSAATFSCLAWIQKVIYQCVQVKLKSFLLSCARGCLEKCTCLSCPGKILTWRYLTVFCARGFRNSEHCIFEG